MSSYDEVSARARGLATHLLSAGDWQGLVDAPDLPTLAARLEQARTPLHLDGAPTAARLERAVRRRAGERLALLARWCRERPELLEVLFADEDRRSLRALLRGAAAGVPPEDRLAGTLPTPALPLRALDTLAAQPSIAALAALLVVWRHPAASALAGAPRRGPPDFLLLETALTRNFAGRALLASRRADALLRWHVETLLDEENVLTALLLADSPSELQLAPLFVEGGRVSLVALEAVARTRPPLAALELAKACFRGTLLDAAFVGSETSRLAERLAAVHRAHLHRTARTEPLGSGPVLDYAAHLRQEVERFQRLAWALALNAPLEERRGEVYQ
ncbi:MAG: V-type ATPase subunit [Myxococcaceae bacterium]